MKRKARRVPVGLSNSFPLPFPPNLAPDGARCILNQGKAVLPGQSDQAIEIAWHADLVNAKDRLRPLRDRALSQCRVEVVSLRIDIHEYRRRSAVPNAI